MSSLKKFKPRYWRSLAELENTPAFREYVENEFPAPLEHAPPNSPERRRFMELMGASFALAGVAGCRWPEDKLVPLSRRPEGVIPGVPRKFATAMDIAGNAVGLHVTSYDGRPIKVDGNPQHPESLGACFTYHQGSVLGVYDPDRSDSVKQGGKQSSYGEFDKFAREHFPALQARGGAGFVVLSERSSSPTLAWLRQQLQVAMPQAKWVTFEPSATPGVRSGSVLAFGAPHRTQYAFQQAKVVLTLDADFMSPTFPAGLSNARNFVRGGRVAEREMSRLYTIESGYSHAGALADHRLPLRAELMKAVAAFLDAEISGKVAALPELGPAQPKPNAPFLAEAGVQKFLAAVVKDLLANVGNSIIVAGLEQPAEVHALVHRLNTLLGNVGRTVFYTDDFDQSDVNDAQALKELTAGLANVDTLLILGGNPAYTAPADVPFAESLAKVKTSIHLSLYEDETSALVTWHLPAAHYLESWGDVRANSGLVTITQPLIAPIYGGRSAIEILALVLGDPKPDGQAIVRRASQGVLAGDRTFRKVLNDGFVMGSALPHVAPKLRPLPAFPFSEREVGAGKASNGSYEVVFVFDSKVHDGRFANNGWLQELPGTFTKLGWENAVLVPMSVAQEIGLSDGHLVTLTLNGKSITLPGVVAPGQADGSVRVALGYGRTRAGRVGGLVSAGVASTGANAYALRTSDATYIAGGGSLALAGVGERLAYSQDLYAIDPLGREGIQDRVGEIVREGTLKEYREKPHFADEKVEHKPLLSLWVPPVSYEGHKWGMAIDLNKCIGCSSCVTACQAENNVPVVGREPMAMGREMFWLRVDRYYKGDPANAEVAFQPMPCQQCENAPCEQVCPVGATMHSREGLNDMVYNRCIGTRYCSNNCPYKVRRFNYFNYNLDVIGVTPYTPTDDPKMKVKSMVFNPDVTVRSRGVMEKCTFCVQRIQNAKIRAKNEKRPIADGEIRTACQDTCPTEAIVFGDLNDPQSEVKRQQSAPRAYSLLGELNNRPRVQYLARVKNPNPELV
ncbi:MAG: TAT-variant-translocated molybdopterin oxidoreductase [Myxococcota bacterium]